MSVVPSKLEHHEILKQKLQGLYRGMAHKYDPTTNGGKLLPPHGMVMMDEYTKIIVDHGSKLLEANYTIARIQALLNTKHAYVPMVVKQGGYFPCRRNQSADAQARFELFQELGRATADKMQAEEHVAYWTKNVMPVDDPYMEDIKNRFHEKAQLYKDLVIEGISVKPW